MHEQLSLQTAVVKEYTPWNKKRWEDPYTNINQDSICFWCFPTVMVLNVTYHTDHHKNIDYRSDDELH